MLSVKFFFERFFWEDSKERRWPRKHKKHTNKQRNSRLCGDRDETINHIISECRKLAQKEYKARHDWVGKVIHWEMCRKFLFNHTNKWYMHNPAPVQEKDSHKLQWDFNIQTDHQIPTRRPDLIIINKKKKEENLQNCRLCCPGGPQIWRKVKRRISTSTLLENWKSCGTWK